MKKWLGIIITIGVFAGIIFIPAILDLGLAKGMMVNGVALGIISVMAGLGFFADYLMNSCSYF